MCHWYRQGNTIIRRVGKCWQQRIPVITCTCYTKSYWMDKRGETESTQQGYWTQNF